MQGVKIPQGGALRPRVAHEPKNLPNASSNRHSGGGPSLLGVGSWPHKEARYEEFPYPMRPAMAPESSMTRLFVRSGLWFVATAALLFVVGGTINWPAAWIFLAETHGYGFAIGLWMARHDPGLLAERLSSPIRTAQETWDRVFVLTIIPLLILWFVVMPVDAVRYGFSHVPVWLQAVGAVTLLLSLRIVDMTFRANTYAAPVVRIQTERAHRVVSTGPYAYVRHPMYLGLALFILSSPLLLGSWCGLALAPVLIAVVAVRAVLEERMLAEKLAGYAEYAARVRYRLIPLIW
jgi:protein-S-isoprenylcysteine O-methyltransferase Ste14